MTFNFDENWRITADGEQWIVEQRTGKKKKLWRHVSYHTTLAKACEAMIQRRLRLADTDSEMEAIQQVKRDTDALCALLSSKFEVTIRG